MSEKVKALGMVLDGMARKKAGRKPPMATCPAHYCGEPLVSTLRFRGYEFICVVCKRHWGFVDPTPAESTPELKARYEELKAQWDAEIKESDDARE